MTARSSNNVVFPPDSHPYCVSYAESTSRWWQWALSIPVESNPVNDMTGANCAINQNSPVWFLAGTLGGVVDRTCIIPSDKAILMPILNHGELADSQAVKSEEELLSYTTKEMNIISDLEVMVDSVKLSALNRYRVRSPIFDIILPEKSLFEGTPGPARGASDGYWLFLRPLSKGKHKIHTFGSCLSGKVRIGVNYDLTAI